MLNCCYKNMEIRELYCSKLKYDNLLLLQPGNFTVLMIFYSSNIAESGSTLKNLINSGS